MSSGGMDDQQWSVAEHEASAECFASAEARFEYEKARRLRRVAVLLGGAVALVVFGIAMYRLGRGGSPSDHDAGHAAEAPAALGVDPVGSPDASVKILAIVPAGSDCHSGIIAFLKDVAGKQPDRIRAEFTTMEAYGNDNLTAVVGQVCAAVLINGSSEVTIQHDGKDRRLSLVGTEPTHYTLADVGAAITAVYTVHYGAPAEPLYDAAACSGPGGGSCSTQPGAAGTPGQTAGEPLVLPGFREMQRPAPAQP